MDVHVSVFLEEEESVSNRFWTLLCCSFVTKDVRLNPNATGLLPLPLWLLRRGLLVVCLLASKPLCDKWSAVRIPEGVTGFSLPSQRAN